MKALWLVLALAGVGGVAASRARLDGFDHAKHAKLFPTCEGCHAGIADPKQSLWPTAESCASCHDGTIQKRVTWTAPQQPRVSNLRFTHSAHAREATRKLGSDSTLACAECHFPSGQPWMQVQSAKPEPCLACHGIRAEHVAAPDTSCATCHLTLAEATSLPWERIAHFATPPGHKAPGFLGAKGHGAAAHPMAGGAGVAASCATCHARDFCAQCHVNAPEVAVIQALAPDPRSLAITAELKAPASHEDGRFLSRHGGLARRDARSCATCHTQESCAACHRTLPSEAATLATAGNSGRAPGAKIERKRPSSHTHEFAERHGSVASATPATCSACHARTECLECHRPSAGSNASYHPAGFLSRHPSAAYSRQSDCAECHNQAQFCTTCHQQAGMTAQGPLHGGFHDAKASFIVGHGQAARQSLETCVTCHAERDCLLCHSSQGGRRFDPHGPGFNPDRLRRLNPQTCAACHGRNIPSR